MIIPESIKVLENLILRYPSLKDLYCPILSSINLLKSSFNNDGKLLIAGNGGSSSDSQHIVGELAKSFRLKRPLSENQKRILETADPKYGLYLGQNLELGFPAISLTAHTALISAFSNDIIPELAFAQQINVYGTSKDVFLAISTSGNSRNIIYAAIVARSKGIPVISLTGKSGGKLKNYSDILINVPEVETYIIQELHLPIYHCISQILELEFFGRS